MPHINYDLQRFELVINDHRHYGIITVEEDKFWRNVFDATLLDRFWKDLRAGELYPVENLVTVLRHRLAQSKEKLPRDLLICAFKEDSIGNQPILEIAQQLKTPENITDFVTMLCEGVKEGRKLEITVNEMRKMSCIVCAAGTTVCPGCVNSYEQRLLWLHIDIDVS